MNASIFRCSCKPDVRKWSECWLKYKLQVISLEETSSEQTSTEENEGRVKGFFRKAVEKGKKKLKKVAEALGFSQSSVIAEEKCGKVVLDPKSKAERTKKVVKLISSVDIDNIHSVSLSLTQKNCNFEGAHLYVRYV